MWFVGNASKTPSRISNDCSWETIHAFCAHLIRERPVEAGVAPGFTELEEEQNADLRRGSWREFIDLARAQNFTELRELLDAGMAPHDLDEAFATVCTFPDADFPAGDILKPDTRAVRTELERFSRTLEAHLPTTIATDVGCDLQRAGRALRGHMKFADLDHPEASPSYWLTGNQRRI